MHPRGGVGRPGDAVILGNGGAGDFRYSSDGRVVIKRQSHSGEIPADGPLLSGERGGVGGLSESEIKVLEGEVHVGRI